MWSDRKWMCWTWIMKLKKREKKKETWWSSVFFSFSFIPLLEQGFPRKYCPTVIPRRSRFCWTRALRSHPQGWLPSSLTTRCWKAVGLTSKTQNTQKRRGKKAWNSEVFYFRISGTKKMTQFQFNVNRRFGQMNRIYDCLEGSISLQVKIQSTWARRAINFTATK